MEIGGAEKSVLEIGSYLKKSQYEPMVLTSGGRLIEKLKNEDINYIENEFNQVMLEEGYKSLFYFPTFKEFIRSISDETN